MGKPKENHTKTNPKADEPTRETIRTIRKPYTTIESNRKSYEKESKADGPTRGR